MLHKRHRKFFTFGGTCNFQIFRARHSTQRLLVEINQMVAGLDCVFPISAIMPCKKIVWSRRGKWYIQNLFSFKRKKISPRNTFIPSTAPLSSSIRSATFTQSQLGFLRRFDTKIRGVPNINTPFITNNPFTAFFYHPFGTPDATPNIARPASSGGLKELRVRKISSFKNLGCQQTCIMHKSPTLFSKHCFIKFH